MKAICLNAIRALTVKLVNKQAWSARAMVSFLQSIVDLKCSVLEQASKDLET